MPKPSTSYTLRIPKDLKRLLEAEAARTECTLAATVVNMCWMGLEVRAGVAQQDRGLSGTHRSKAGETQADVGSSPTPGSKPDMQALREICAGKFSVHDPVSGDSLLNKMTRPPGLGPTPVRVPICVVCESPMREVKGKWACADMSCGKYGVEQKPRW